MNYSEEILRGILEKQRKYFRANETLDVAFRMRQLKKLKDAISGMNKCWRMLV